VSIPTILAVVTLGVGVPLNLYVTAKLWRLAHGAPHVKALRERAIAATAVLLVVTVFGLIFANNDLVPPIVSFDATKFLTRGAMVVVAIVPASYWLWVYRR
jgi:hypothetical protein